MEEERGMANPMDSDRPRNLSKERLGSIDVFLRNREQERKTRKERERQTQRQRISWTVCVADCRVVQNGSCLVLQE